MTIAQWMSIIGLSSLIAGAALAARYLRKDRGLRRAFGGLAVSAVAGVGIAFWRSPIAVWSLALLMLGGIGWLVINLHVEKSRKGVKGDGL